MATQIGTVKVIIGTVTAETMDGQVHTLREGDILFADEILSTGLSGSIVIEYVGGQKVNIDPDVKLILEDIVNKQSATDDKNISETPDSEESSRVEHDLNEGNNLVTVHYLSPTATPDAGFDTKGVENKIINFSDNLLNIRDGGIKDLLLNYIGGDSVTADLQNLITDTAPIANADQGVVTEDGTIISSGNVITGTGGATADLVPFGTTVVGFAVGDTGASLDGAGVGTLLEGTYGSIIISADGSYTYTLNNADPDTNALSDGDTVTDVFTYTIKDTDGDLTYTTVTININGSTDVIFNNSPVFDSASYNFNYAENTAAGTTIATVASTDADIADTVSYSIKTNVDDGLGNPVYAIDSTTGDITLTTEGAVAFTNDFEVASNAHGIVVTASDGTNNTDVNVSLNETDLNDNSPVFGAASYSFNYAENTTAGTTLGTVAATDADIADTVTYSIKTNVDDGSGNPVYAINSTTGAISLTAAGATAFANDFETASNAHAIVASATDGSNATDVNVSLNEMDVNEVGNRPVFGSASYSFDYAENTPSGTTLGTVTATDADIADTVSYSIKTNVDDGSGNPVYAINSTTGAISLTTAGATAFANDFEAVSNAHDIVVSATDGSNTTDVNVLLNETDVNEVGNSPVFGFASYSFDYAENTATGTTLGTVAATDADIADTVSYSIKTNVDDGLGNPVYAIDSTTGAITLTTAGEAAFANDFEAASNAHGIVVTASDGTNNTDVNVSLNETNVNEAPTLDLDANNSTVGGANHVTSYALGQQGVSIGDLDVSISDVDSTIQSATVTLTNAQANDLLFAESLPNGISVSAYNAGTGVITLTGVATTSAYQTAIESIKFYNADTAASTIARTIDVSLIDNDGASSNTATTTISVASNSLSVSTQSVIQEGNSAIFRVELAEARTDLTKINFTVSGDVTADDDFYNFGDVTRDVQYESAPGVWSDVSFDGTNYYVSIAGSATLNPVTGLPYTHVDIKIKTKSDAVSDDNENLTLNASIDIPASGDLSTMANTSASASTLVSELPLLFVSAPTTVTEGSDATFEIGLSNIKSTDTLVQLQLSGDIGSLDYDQTSFQYSTDDGTTWLTSFSDIQGSSISILGNPNVAKSVLVKITTLPDAVTESLENLVLTATTVDAGISPAGNSASDNTAVVDPIILSLNEEKDGVSTGTTSTTTTVDPNFDYIKVGDGANGSVVDNGDGTLTYSADTDFSGSDSFIFTKVDKVTGQSFNATAEVNTTAIADTPTISISLNNKVTDGLPEVVVDGSFSTSSSWKQLTGPGASGNYGDYDPLAVFTPTAGEASFPKAIAIVESFGLNSLNYGDTYTLKFDTNLLSAADLTVRFVHIAADNSITSITSITGYNDELISTGLINHSITLTIPDTVGDGTGLVANAIIFENTDNGDSMVIDNVSLKGDTTNTYDVNVTFATADTDGSEFIQDTITISGAPASAIFSNNGTNVGTDLGGGNWSFTQAQIDGLKITVSPSDASTGFTLVSTVTSEESTNGASTATGSDSVIFIDSNDVPLIGDNKLIMANETGFVGTLVDTIDTYFSTDGGNVFSWEPDASTLPVIYADGELVALAYTVTGTDQGTLTGTINGGATTVFTVDITMGDGNATDVVYTQVAELLGVKETFDGGIVLPGGGNNDTIVLGFNDSNGSASGVNAIVTAHNLIEDTAAEIASPEAEHTVNTNNFFIGVNSNNMNAGQQLIFDFATVATDGSGNTTSKNDVVAMEIVLFNFGSEKSGDELFITVLTGDDIATATREDIVLTGDPDLTEQHYTVTSSSGDAFIGVEFLAGNESSYKLGIESISSISYNTDFDMDLVYTITDADGDSDSGNVVISLDGDEIIVYDASKTSIDAGDEQSSSGGMDTLVFNSGDSIDFSLDHSDILNFEAIDLSNNADTESAGAHSLTSITLQDVLDITDTGNDLRVFGDNADIVTLMNESGNTWTDTGTVTEGSTTFTIYQSGSGVNLANLMVDTDVNASIL